MYHFSFVLVMAAFSF